MKKQNVLSDIFMIYASMIMENQKRTMKYSAENNGNVIDFINNIIFNMKTKINLINSFMDLNQMIV